MFAAPRTAAPPLQFGRARVSLALMGIAALGFLASAVLGASANARRAEATERAELYYREHPYLHAPLEILLNVEKENAPSFDPSLLAPRVVAASQAELDAILAEADAAARATPAYRFGLVGNAVSALALLLHPFLHAGWLHLLWNLALLASAGARLEPRLGSGRYAGLLCGASAAGACMQIAASSPGAAPLVGLSAATAGILGAFAVRPDDVTRDPLAASAAKPHRSPIRVAAILGAIVCIVSAAIGINAPSFAPLAQLAGFAAGAVAMFAFVRVGWVRGPADAKLAPELAQALGLLQAGDAPAAIERVRARLDAGVDDPLAARALGLVLRGRSDAPEALSSALRRAIERNQRGAARALWAELSEIGAVPRDASTTLRTLASWLRGAGAQGQARAAAIASLDGADAAAITLLAKEARRADPVVALRAAERALALTTLSELERKALLELYAQARKDAQNAGVIVLDREREAAAKAQRAAPTPRLSEPARRQEAPDCSSAEEAPAPAAEEHDRAFFERDAIDLTAAEPEALGLPDLELEGDAALLDALHDALSEDGAELSAADAHDGSSPRGSRGIASHEDEARDTAGQLASSEPKERTVVRFAEPPPARSDASGLSPDEFVFGDAADALFDAAEKREPQASPLRPLRVNAATPERLEADAAVLEIEGRGRAQLAYAKIDAIAAAGVRGLSSNGKVVLLIDLVIGIGRGEGELRVVRLRADAFDPRTLVEGHTSPLAALRALVAELRTRTRAIPLPRESEAGAPFRIYADLATYEREVLGAERK